MPKTSIFLPSYNKPEYVLDALHSVVAQTSPDWELWLLENSTDDGVTRGVIESSGLLADARIRYVKVDFRPAEREEFHVTARLLNQYYQHADEYILFLADDDLLKPECVDTCASYLNSRPSQNVCYFSLEQIMLNENKEILSGRGNLVADSVRRSGQVDCRIDSGQVFIRKKALESIEYPYLPEDALPAIARHSDGIYLQRIAELFPFYPIPLVLATHRFTPLSNWTRMVGSRAIPQRMMEKSRVMYKGPDGTKVTISENK